MSGVLSTLRDLIAAAVAADDPQRPLPTVLEGAAGRLAALLSLDLEPTGKGLDEWLGTFRQLTEDEALRETLVVRVLQVGLPRAAESLALLGVIRMEWDTAATRPRAFRIEWEKLTRITQNPGGEAMALLGQRVNGLVDLKALQVLLLLLISGPDELLALEYRRKGFLALPAGEGVTLDELIALVNSPVAVPLSPALAAAPATLAWIRGLGPAGLGAARIELDGPSVPILPDPPGINLAHPLDGLTVTLVVDASTLQAMQLPLGDSGWALTGEAAGTGRVQASIRITDSAIDPASGADGTARIKILLGKMRAEGADALLIGDANGTHLAIGDVKVGVTIFPLPSVPAPAGEASSIFGYTLALDRLRLAVGTDVLKSFAGGLSLPGTIRFESALDLSFLQGVPGIQGSTGGGGIAFGVDIPQHLGFSIGGSGAGLRVDDMLIRIEVSIAGKGIEFRVAMRFDARAEIGPVTATVSGVGAWLGRWGSGNGGVLEPTGVGLTLAAGPVAGGGYFARLAPGEYAGALNLKILGIGAFAYGVYKELTGGSASFVAVIGIRLPLPGIQIGFGFAISGFGGLVGIHRRADTDRLRERLVSGTAGDVLFTEDPTKNAPRILGELRELFPDEHGVHVFGPTIQLNWLQILKLDVGLFIELPGPRKVFIAGSGRLVIGSEDFALVYIRLDFIGGIDFTTSLVFFDGALVGSHILGILKITGGIAFRLGFGADPYFLYSVGGFHPAFTPSGLVVPQVPRAGASVDLGFVWFTQQMYFAITSQTVQFGARTEAGIEIGPIRVHGWFGFDALIEMRPFHFVASIDAGMSAEFEGFEFASIRVQGELTGPGPLVLRATASVKILVRISKSITLTIDDSAAESVATIDNLATHLRGEITDPANLRGDGEDLDVVFAGAGATGTAMIPVGAVVWEQKRVPLDRLLQKAEGVRLSPPRSVGISVEGVATTSEDDVFSLASHTDVTDATVLSGPTFSPGRSGFRLNLAGSPKVAAGRVAHVDAVALILLPHRKRFDGLFTAEFAAGLRESMGERVFGAPVKHQAAAVRVAPEKWTAPDGSVGHAADVFLAAGGAARPVSTALVDVTGVL